jgi:hypothetical protein
LASCLTVGGGLGVSLLSDGAEAHEASLCIPHSRGDYVDNASNYSSRCTLTVDGEKRVYGEQGVCIASIRQAVKCAGEFFENHDLQSNNYTITIGSGTQGAPFSVDLTHDISFGKSGDWQPDVPAIAVRGLNSNGSGCSGHRQGCLVIQGASSSAYTTLTLATPQHEIEVDDSSHVLFQGLTLRKAPEAMSQGNFASAGSVVMSDGTTTETFATLTVDITPQDKPVPIQDILNFATIADAGSGYPASSKFNLTLAATGGNCDTPAVLTVESDANGAIRQIDQLATQAVCTVYPYSTTVFSGTDSNGNGSASFYVAYLASPLSEWINAYNFYLANRPQGEAFALYMKAYANTYDAGSGQYVPVSVPSNQWDSQGQVIRNFAQWGAVHLAKSYIPVPPQYMTGKGGQNLWMMTFSNPITQPAVPPYFSTPGNIVCMHTDYGNAVETNNPHSQSDLIFKDIVWVTAGRSEFENTDNTQIIDSAIQRDASTYKNGQLPCYGSGAGGPQFSQPVGHTTYGNRVMHFTAVATADDSLAFYNDIGGANGKAQSYVKLSTFVSPQGHPIRLYNDQPPGQHTMLDTGTCPANGNAGGTGSPVCVDKSTQRHISGDLTACDADYWVELPAPPGWGSGCPVWYPYATFLKK